MENDKEPSVCEYCREDFEGYVKPLGKNGHAFVRFGMNGWELSPKANGGAWKRKNQVLPDMWKRSSCETREGTG